MNRLHLAPLIILLSGCFSTSAEKCSGVFSLEELGWYEEHMKAADAEPLCTTEGDQKSVFRFTWLRSFHNPIVITLEKQGDMIVLEAVRLDGAGGYDPGEIVERNIAELAVDEYEAFTKLIDKMDFWGLKGQDQLMKEALIDDGEIIIGTDGAQWIIEGANSTHAHSVDRWSPDEGPFYEAGLYLLEKSKIRLNGPIY